MRLHAERTIPGRVVRIATYGALAIGLYTVENLLPSPIPWLRIGASNVAVVLALYELGVVPAAGVLLLKLVLGSLLFGRFLSPFFWFGLAGGTLGLAAMAVAFTAGRRWLSVVGVSIAGGVFHNVGQLAVARLLLLPADAASYLLPILVLVGTVGGGVIGIVAGLVQEYQHKDTGSMKTPKGKYQDAKCKGQSAE